MYLQHEEDERLVISVEKKKKKDENKYTSGNRRINIHLLQNTGHAPSDIRELLKVSNGNIYPNNELPF